MYKFCNPDGTRRKFGQTKYLLPLEELRERCIILYYQLGDKRVSCAKEAVVENEK